MKLRKLLTLVVGVIIFISVRQRCFAVSVEKSVVKDANGNAIYTTTRTRSYNNQNKVTEVKTVDIKNKVLVDYIYGYDANGNVISEKDSLNGSYKEFKFDSANQLVTEKYYDGLGKLTKEIDYQYDNKGNRTKKLVSCNNFVETTSYKYNKENQITKVNEKQDYKYDESGNLVSDGKKTNTFDSKGKLTQVKQENKVIESYQYNAEGGRVKKESAGEAEVYRYNAGQLSSITDLTGKPKISFARDTNGKLVSMTDDKNTYWYLSDGLSNVRGLADKDGTKVVSYEYDAFGNCTESQGSEIRVINPFRYMSYQYDEKTGYYYLGARYYDPLTGRFISADGYTGNALITSNLYKYTNNNPLKYKDSTGHWVESIDSKLPEWAKKEIRSLTVGWNNAVTNEAKDMIHAKANCVRAYAEKQNPTTLKGISVAFTVRKDSKGDDVRSLQQALKDKGCAIVVDGDFGSNTDTALKQYQTSSSLLSNGIADVNTWAKLGEVYYGVNYSKLSQRTSYPNLYVNGKYDRDAAVAYATNPNYSSPDKNEQDTLPQYWDKKNRNYNPDYERFDNLRYYLSHPLAIITGSSDCANFTSQALFAGGVKMTNNWYFKWIEKDGPDNSVHLIDDFTGSWVRPKEQLQYLKDSGYVNGDVIILKSVDDMKNAVANDGIQKGDMIFLQNSKEGIHHSMMVTGFEYGGILFSAHSNDRINRLVNNETFKGDHEPETMLIVRMK